MLDCRRWIVLAAAQHEQTSAMWDEAAAKEARAVVDRGLSALDKMDIAAFKAVAAPDLTAYDIDLDSKPVRMTSLAESKKYVEDIFAGAKKMGASLRFERRATDCRATSAIAYRTLEYNFVAAMPGGSEVSQPSQTTAILAKGKDGWKWTHWHTSLSSPPAAPATPAGE